jgi:tRNA threonylcarbamoyl adenosine modification protein YeaZ
VITTCAAPAGDHPVRRPLPAIILGSRLARVLVLALDTSTAAVTVAVVDGGEVLAEHTEFAPNRHGEVLAPLVVAVLGGRRPDAVAVGAGPGPFTGLRVGLVTAAALSDAYGVPAYAECSLDVLAHGRGAVLVVTDARRHEVYWAAYDTAGARVAGPHVDRPGDVPVDRPVLGPATALYPHVLAGEAAYPRAADLAARVGPRLGAPPDPLTPLYLRRPDAVPPGAPKPVLR